MKKVNTKQMEAVLALPGIARFEHFIKVVVDWQEVWGLYQHGWAQSSTSDGIIVLPFWPAQEYAQICAVNEWANYEARKIPLDDFIADVLPKLKLEGVLPGVFLTPTGQGVTPSIDELIAALEAELQNYK